MWEESFGEIPSFNWINLYSVLEWEGIKKAYNFAVFKFDETLKRIINKI